jgi:peptidoglycan/xylan/chitin deacetylase (PgdA/CDA1 family)
MYHRVAELDSDPFWLAVTPPHFAEHLEVLRRHCRPVPLRRLADPGFRPGMGKPVVALTFDDGYVDNLQSAKPLLERWDVPATVFVTTGYVGQPREFWWDELEGLLLRPGNLPAALELDANGDSRAWEVGEAARYSAEDQRRYRGWNCEQPPGPRQRFLLAVHQWLRPLPEAKQRRVLDRLAALTGAAPARPGYRAVSPEELLALAGGGLVEVGAHTMTHPALAAHPANVQRQEIRQSKAGLEEVLGRPVTSFAYPYGTAADYTAETVAILRELGFGCGCAVRAGLVDRTTDRLQLPRFVVRDWDGETLHRNLGEWFHA